jgi:hypothetical protein
MVASEGAETLEGEEVHQDQAVFEMVEEILTRQAKALSARTGQSFESALEAVADTAAGRQLRELANSEHRDEGAANWQSSLLWQRIEERHYSWLAGYMKWLEDKEPRAQYHALLEEELASLRG